MSPCMALALLGAIILTTVSSVNAFPNFYDHPHELYAPLPRSWHHAQDHSAHKLFRRQATTNSTTFPTVGSPTWRAAYPTSTPDTNSLPSAWIDALNAAVSAGKIPDIPVTTLPAVGAPVYPAGVNPDSSDVCAATNRICRNPDDIWDAPDGVLGVGFDDGPLPSSQDLYVFLQSQKQRATHFFIGVNILNNPDMFTMAFETLQDDIALHTWTHPYMTTLTNLQLLAQFGWTMQIIHDSTGGRLPRYWRPPFGDTDNRVHAIAMEVFGLTAIIWNHDTEDWTMASGGTTPDKIHAEMETWLGGPKSPGLIILEHELTNATVQAFIDAYPLIKADGWTATSVSELVTNVKPWQNANGNSGSVTTMGIVSGGDSALVVDSDLNLNSSGSSSGSRVMTGSTSQISASSANISHATSSTSGTVNVTPSPNADQTSTASLRISISLEPWTIAFMSMCLLLALHM